MTRRGSEEAEVALSTIWFIAECRYRNALASHEAGQDWAAPEDTIQLYQDLRHKAFRYWLTWSLNRELTRQGENPVPAEELDRLLERLEELGRALGGNSVEPDPRSFRPMTLVLLTAALFLFVGLPIWGLLMWLFHEPDQPSTERGAHWLPAISRIVLSTTAPLVG
jgi:hypothetical protein